MTDLFALDTETWPFFPGMMAPPIVCVSHARGASASLVLREEGLDLFERVLADKRLVIAGAHIAYDFGCACALRPSLVPKVFQAYEDERVWDVLIGEALHDILFGQLGYDLVSGRRFERYSLEIVEKRLLGIDRAEDKHGEDAWRRRYHELDGVPLAQWPEKARTYAVDDARNTLACAKAQVERGSNARAMSEQARAAWALHLSHLWGIRTDACTVAEVTAEVTKMHEETVEHFTELGFYRENGTRDTRKIARRVAEAYGATAACTVCSGSGRVVEAKPKTCKDCGGTGVECDRDAFLESGDEAYGATAACTVCSGSGRVVEAKPKTCKDCGGTGVDLAGVPLTPTGNVKCDRDALLESGDEDLEAYAHAGMNEKWFSTYLPVLQQGTERPINAEVNVLVATGRTSMSHPNLQNLPRKGRVRECFFPRPEHVFATVDYSTLELCTLAQVCLWYTGSSRMAEAINAGQDLHSLLGATLLHISYDEFLQRLHAKDKMTANFRQLSKAGNFGYPGGLGAFKFVAFARQSYNARLCELAGVADKCGVQKTADKQGRQACAKCLEVATDLRKTWFGFWPEVAEYHRRIQTLTDHPHGGDIEVLGPVGGIVRGGCGFCDGANTGFQGLAARGAKTAYFNVSKECYTNRDSPLWGSRPLVFVHDEIIAELPETKASGAAYRISEIMMSTMRQYTPDVRIAAPPALMRRWLKGAEPVHVCSVHGRGEARCCSAAQLVPWEAKK